MKGNQRVFYATISKRISFKSKISSRFANTKNLNSSQRISMNSIPEYSKQGLISLAKNLSIYSWSKEWFPWLLKSSSKRKTNNMISSDLSQRRKKKIWWKFKRLLNKNSNSKPKKTNKGSVSLIDKLLS